MHAIFIFSCSTNVCLCSSFFYIFFVNFISKWKLTQEWLKTVLYLDDVLNGFCMSKMYSYTHKIFIRRQTLHVKIRMKMTTMSWDTSRYRGLSIVCNFSEAKLTNYGWFLVTLCNIYQLSVSVIAIFFFFPSFFFLLLARPIAYISYCLHDMILIELLLIMHTERLHKTKINQNSLI